MPTYSGYKTLTDALTSGQGVIGPCDNGGPGYLGGYEYAIGEETEAIIPEPRARVAGAFGVDYNGDHFNEGETYYVLNGSAGVWAHDDPGIIPGDGFVLVRVEFTDDDLLAAYAYFGQKVGGGPRSRLRLARCTVAEQVYP